MKEGLDNKSISDEEEEIPSSEKLKELKETDFGQYLYWIDLISKIELKKHEERMEEIGKEQEQEQEEKNKITQEELNRLYNDGTPEERRNSQLYGQN